MKNRLLVFLILFFASFNGRSQTVNLNTGLVVHYLFNNNPKDISGNNFDAVLNGTTYCPDKFGSINSAIKISTKTNFIDIPDINNNVISISLWYYFEGTNNTYNTILCRQGGNYHHLLVEPTNNEIGFYNNTWVGSGYKLTVGKWYNIVLIKENSNSTLFVNGVQVQSSTTSFNNVDYPLSVIGNGGATPFNQGALGAIDNVRIYNRVLNINEVKILNTEVPNYLIVDTENIKFDYFANSKTVKIKSDSTWLVVPDKEWIRVYPDSCAKDSNFVISCAENKSGTIRNGLIKVVGIDSTFIISISQDTIIPNLSLAAQKLEVSSYRNNQKIKISSNYIWSASNKTKWLNLYPTNCYGVDSLELITQPNRNNITRTDTISITSEKQSKKLIVSQTGYSNLSNLATVLENQNKIRLTWNNPNIDTTVFNYCIYRNFIPINYSKELKYVDTLKYSGEYKYFVTVMYKDSSVLGSDTISYKFSGTDFNQINQGKRTKMESITQPPLLAVNIGTDITANPNSVIKLGSTSIAIGGTEPYKYQWSPSIGLDDTTVTNPSLNVNTVNSYSVTVTDAKGCSETKTIRLTIISEIDELKNSIDISVFPNPNKGNFILKMNVLQKSQNVSIKITNTSGQIVYTKRVTNLNGVNEIPINLDYFNSGMYFIQIQSVDLQCVKQIIINR